MATYRIKINERTKSAKAVLEFLRNLDFVEVEKEVPVLSGTGKPYNKTTMKALEEIRKGKGKKITNLKKFLDEI